MDQIVYIYGLVDSRNELTIENVRYVGKTKRKSVERYKQHLRDCSKYNTPINCWIRMLLNKNRKPLLLVLDNCGLNDWRSLEKKYIRELRKTNDLLNISDGGYGIEDESRLVKTYQYSEFGKCVNEYKSIISAARKMNVVPSTISSALDQVVSKSSCGYYWFTSKERARKFQFKRPRQFQKAVVSYTLDGYFFNEFENILTASNEMKIPSSNIVHSISSYGKCCAGNYLWFYADKIPNIVEPYHRNGYVSIVQKNKNGEVINEFKSISEASRTTGISWGKISRNVKGNVNSNDEFIFKNKII